MDPIRNPYAPGAGQRPPELAGRDREIEQFGVTLERVAAGRPDRSMVLSGLRGVGKTVLLNSLRSEAVRRAWGTGKLEARADSSIRMALAQATYAAVREVAHRHRDPDRVEQVSGVIKSFALRTEPADRKVPAGTRRWQPPMEVGAVKGRADSGDLELDLIELFTDVASLARDLGVGIALFVDEMQDVSPTELGALCGACHEISQQAAPVLVVGAGLPHLPVALAASRSYAERLFRYVSVDRLPREMAERAWTVPAGTEDVDYEPDALAELYTLTDGYPYFVQAYGKVTWDVAVGTRSALPTYASGAGGRVGAGRRLLRRPLRPRHPRRARLHERDGRPRRRDRRPGRAYGGHRRPPRPQAAVALTGS